MPRRSFSRRSSRRIQRRKLVWARVPIPATQLTGEPASAATALPVKFDALSNFEASLGASTIGVTVVRVRGWFATTPSAAELFRGRMTMRVGEDADNTPDSDDNAFSDVAQNRDYFLFEPFAVFPTETASNSDISKRLIDVKSSRKVEELNQTIFLEFSGVTLVAADTVTIAADLSMLLMLP